MLLYDKIVPLNRERHSSLRLRTDAGDARFAAQTHYLPLSGAEFYQASRTFPILFTSGEGAGSICLVGLKEGQNLFVDEAGQWDRSAYAPAYVRRYPFILAKADEGGDYTVCFDESYSGFNDEEGEALFDKEGKNTPYLQRSVEFLNRYTAEMRRTQEFMDKLQELSLLKAQNLQVTTASGKSIQLRDFQVVDENRLGKIADGTLGELHREGYLGWIYAHLISLNNLVHLSARQGQQQQEEKAEEEKAG